MTTSTAAPIRHPLPQTYHYIRFSISSPQDTTDALHIRHTLQDALTHSFGAALSHLYLDVLWVSSSGTSCVVRANSARYVPLFLFQPVSFSFQLTDGDGRR